MPASDPDPRPLPALPPWSRREGSTPVSLLWHHCFASVIVRLSLLLLRACRLRLDGLERLVLERRSHPCLHV